MTTPVSILILIACIASVWHLLIWSKRRYRKAELLHHITMLRDQHGCKDSYEKLNQCLHILEHYGIKISEIPGTDFEKTEEGLNDFAYQSFKRYVDAFEQHLKIQWTFDVEPDGPGVILIPVTEGWDRPHSVNMYGRSIRTLKRLRKQQRNFLVVTRRLTGGGFLI